MSSVTLSRREQVATTLAVARPPTRVDSADSDSALPPPQVALILALLEPFVIPKMMWFEDHVDVRRPKMTACRRRMIAFLVPAL